MCALNSARTSFVRLSWLKSESFLLTWSWQSVASLARRNTALLGPAERSAPSPLRRVLARTNRDAKPRFRAHRILQSSASDISICPCHLSLAVQSSCCLLAVRISQGTILVPHLLKHRALRTSISASLNPLPAWPEKEEEEKEEEEEVRVEASLSLLGSMYFEGRSYK